MKGIILSIICVTSCLAQNVYTPNGTLVPTVSYFTYSLTQGQLNAQQEAVEDGVYGSSCVVVFSSSNNYNCHGYAWNMFQNNGRQVAIDDYNHPGSVGTYISDGSYSSTASTTVYGVRVRYSGDHSAVVINQTNRFQSKWGPGPVVNHAPGDVPPSYSSVSGYYRCGFSSYVNSAQFDGGSIVYSSSPSFVANTGSHSMNVWAPFSPNYSFSTYPSMPGISIWSQSGNNVYFDKPAYNQQGRYIFVTVTNGCTTSPTQTGIYFADPPGYRMSAFPTIANGEVTVDFGTSLSQFASKVDFKGKLDDSSRASKLLLYNENNLLVRDFSNDLKSSIIKVSTSQLKPGTYYFKAIFEDNSQETKRLIIK